MASLADSPGGLTNFTSPSEPTLDSGLNLIFFLVDDLVPAYMCVINIYQTGNCSTLH